MQAGPCAPSDLQQNYRFGYSCDQLSLLETLELCKHIHQSTILKRISIVNTTAVCSLAIMFKSLPSGLIKLQCESAQLIRSKCVDELVNAVQRLQGLQTLGLRGNRLGEENSFITRLAEIEHLSLKRIDLSNNTLHNDTCAEDLDDLVACMSMLRVFNLSNNELDEASALGKSVMMLNKLCTLDLSCNAMSPADISFVLGSCLESSPKLRDMIVHG